MSLHASRCSAMGTGLLPVLVQRCLAGAGMKEALSAPQSHSLPSHCADDAVLAEG